MCIRGGRTFNRHIVDPIKDADNHVTINILHGMAWLGRINRPGPHRTSCLRGLPAACKTGNPFVPFSLKCCTHAEQRIIISVAFCANRKSLDRSNFVYTNQPL